MPKKHTISYKRTEQRSRMPSYQMAGWTDETQISFHPAFVFLMGIRLFAIPGPAPEMESGMKIEYTFVSGQTVTADVDDKWGDVITGLERQEYNLNRRESRRHVSLDRLNADDAMLPSGSDTLAEVLSAELAGEILAAVSTLLPEQKDLVKRVYFLDERISDIAAEFGVSRAAISDRLKKIHRKIKKSMK